MRAHPLLFVVALLALSLSGCDAEKDACSTDADCANGGSCADGACQCPQGWGGSNCGTPSECLDQDGDGHDLLHETGCPAGDDYCDDNPSSWTKAGCKDCMDTDGDGYGPHCDLGSDCDDRDKDVHTGCPVCENKDGDGDVFDPYFCSVGTDYCEGNGSVWTEQGCVECLDEDNDGYGVGCTNGGDCDDSDPSIFSGCGAVELAGGCTMGSLTSEAGRASDELRHDVTFTSGYLLSIHEVTQEAFAALLGSNPSHSAACGPDCPVENVSWYDAVAYANERSRREGFPVCYVLSDIYCASGIPVLQNAVECFEATNGGISSAVVALNGVGVSSPYDCQGYRLPTEAEWECAARSGEHPEYSTYNGDIGSDSLACEANVLDPIAWYCGNSGGQTRVVRGKTPTDEDLHDMLGNVWEWVWDLYGSYPDPTEETENPEGATEGDSRVKRGCSFDNHARYCRSAMRGRGAPGSRNRLTGFRLARTVPP